ncbi:hypothetical protein LUW75_16670 [Streptomyces sp. MRC013]|uniref:hypothetical protein n=1 Tax=Streptomyces sp. MRC013 TaxID=2898276 RepID=UPI0020276431|nr:hypothetical protein [Streptomyces sp. MRC013]URM91337.1 hypothetical protein LUW75_16670 [Streptomyces sp. MRC013]
MHQLADRNKYIGLLFMHIDPAYFELGREKIHEVSAAHARDLSKWTKQLTHVVTSGLNGKYDQITLVEADSLEEIHAAATDFRMGAKGRYIEVSDVIVGVKAPPRGLANRAAGTADIVEPT